MTWFLLFVAIASFLLFALLRKKRLTETEEVWPFYAKKPLSNPEQILYFRLKNALPEHIVLAQVQLSRFLGVKKGNNFQTWNNRINRMSADFVICAKDSSVVAVIELDDSTHDTDKRKTADAKKDNAIKAAGITIHRWNVRAIPDESTIQGLLIKTVPAAPH
jgi:very-short-patch-repair endonuclease